MAVIGIDLGTTNSLVSVWTVNGVQLIPNSFGEYLTPSVVSFDENKQVYVGKIAKERLITDSENTFCEFKRLMGTDHKVTVPSLKKEYRPEELSALVLKQLAEDAEHYLGEKVTEAIISVPAYFDDHQRSATREAGRLAGLNVERLINEPSAAALAYHNRDQQKNACYIIYDFGGGTLDVSVVDSYENIVEIQAVSGDNHLGGKDFNEVIAQHFIEENQIDKNQLKQEEYQIIYREAEMVKIELSSKTKVKREFYLSGHRYEMCMTNQLLINLSEEILKRMVYPLKKVMNDLNLDYDDIDSLILVGGSSKMPVVQQFIQSFMPIKVCKDINVDEIVAIGVGTVAGIKQRKEDIKDLILSDICPFSLGVGVYDGTLSTIIERNEVLPTSHAQTYYTISNNQRHLSIHVYQGEHIQARKNLLIETIEFEIPPRKAGEVSIQIRFSYDINGIFDIDITSNNADVSIHKSIVNKHSGLSNQELEKKRAELKKLKIPPREKSENQMLIEMAERLCMECDEVQREQIRNVTTQFLALLECKDRRKIREGTVKFSVFLSLVEKRNKNMDVDLQYFWDEEQFKSQIENNESSEGNDLE